MGLAGPRTPPAGPPGLAGGLTVRRLLRPGCKTLRPPPRRGDASPPPWPAAFGHPLAPPPRLHHPPAAAHRARCGRPDVPPPGTAEGVPRGDPTLRTHSRPPLAWCVHPLACPTRRAERVAAATSRPPRVPAAVAGVWPGAPSATLRPHGVPVGLATGHRPRPTALHTGKHTASRWSQPASWVFFPGAAPNATRQALEIAGATQERRLFPVACTRLLGSAAPPCTYWAGASPLCIGKATAPSCCSKPRVSPIVHCSTILPSRRR